MIKCELHKKVEITGEPAQILSELCTLQREIYEALDKDMREKMRKDWDTIFAPWSSSEELEKIAVDSIKDLKKSFEGLDDCEAKRKFAKRIVNETRSQFAKHDMEIPKEMRELISYFEDYIKESKPEKEEKKSIEDVIIDSFKEWLLDVEGESEED